MKILNLFAGIGGNRKFWTGEITAVENNLGLCQIYKRLYPDDIIINNDAYQYLEKNYNDYDFIWASPPCQTHTKFYGQNHKPTIPDMRLYGLILFLQRWCKNKIWIVENVRPYYKPLIDPTTNIGRHLFWSNINIPPILFKRQKPLMKYNSAELLEFYELPKDLFDGISLKWSNHDGKGQILRNMVHPLIGEYIFNEIKRKKLQGMQP